MCDSDDPSEGRSGMDLTGFLFGNIDESGQLEDDGLLDGESKRMLSSLTRLGLGSLISEVLEQEEPNRDDEEKDYNQKSPSAIDFFDIDDAAEDIKDIDINTNRDAQRSQPSVEAPTEAKETTNGTPKTEVVDSISDCPQSDVKEEDTNVWKQEHQYYGQNEEVRNDDGYEGDMEGDGGLMPPPTTIPNKQRSEKPRRLETPLAAMLPSKYANIEVTELFPDFRPDKVLLFARLFGPGKLSSLPQIWRGVKKRRRRKRSGSTSSDTPPAAPENQEVQYASDDEEKFLK